MATDSNPNNSINIDIEDAIYALGENGNSVPVFLNFDAFEHIYTHVGRFYKVELHYKWYKDLDPGHRSSQLNFTRGNDDHESIELMHKAFQGSVWPTGGSMKQTKLIRGYSGAGLFHLKVVLKSL